MNTDKYFLKKAIEQAKFSLERGGFPAGSVLVKDWLILAESISIGNLLFDPTEHSDTSCIKKACKNLETTNLSWSILYSSIEPCLMCFSVANWARISKIVFCCKKTQHMINIHCYEWSNNSVDINKLNNHKIEFEHINDFEDEILKLISDWEIKLTENN